MHFFLGVWVPTQAVVWGLHLVMSNAAFIAYNFAPAAATTLRHSEKLLSWVYCAALVLVSGH